jgi:hypothetical protein
MSGLALAAPVQVSYVPVEMEVDHEKRDFGGSRI